MPKLLSFDAYTRDHQSAKGVKKDAQATPLGTSRDCFAACTVLAGETTRINYRALEGISFAFGQEQWLSSSMTSKRTVGHVQVDRLTEDVHGVYGSEGLCGPVHCFTTIQGMNLSAAQLSSRRGPQLPLKHLAKIRDSDSRPWLVWHTHIQERTHFTSGKRSPLRREMLALQLKGKKLYHVGGSRWWLSLCNSAFFPMHGSEMPVLGVSASKPLRELVSGLPL